ncbi:MAG: HDOD domain-containing protein [Desulfobacterota bacterium]|nr:HDOD domain-containing protein [Thermodesulfobacteriota bacterium]
MKSLIVDVHSIPVLPEIADSVIRMALDEEVSVAKIAGLIEKDQSLTARILSMANSSYYKRSRQVHTVKDAVVAIGAEAVRTMALGLCVLNLFPSRKGSALDHKNFWRHSFGCAMYAEAMMSKIEPHFGAKAFCAGLLHDIGKLLLELTQPGEYAAVIEKAKDGARTLEEVEKEMLGITHAEVGRDVLAHWKLPRLYEESVWCHHAPVQVIDEDQFRVSGVVNIANTLAHMTGIGSSGNCYPQQVSAALMRKLSLSEELLDGLMASVPRQIDMICEGIGIGKATEGLFSLVNRASVRLSEISMKLQQESLVAGIARRRSEILLKVLKELNSASKITDALARASEILFREGLIKGFMGGFRLGDTNLVFEHRGETSPRFIRVGDAEVRGLVLEGGYSTGMSLPSGVFVYLDLTDLELGDDQEFVSSLIGAVASSLRRIHAENALNQEKTLLRQALKAASQEKQKTEELMELNRELMDASTFGLCLVDDKGLVRIENPMSQELRWFLGIAGKDLLASLQASSEKGASLLKDALVSRTARDVVWGRDERSFRITLRPVRVGGWTLLSLWDISSELDEQKRTLAYAKMTVVGSLAASMAHNMKSPLGAIHGFASIIRDDLRLGRIRVLRGSEEDQDLPDMLGNISTASENLLKIVNQLLSFTRKWESPEGEVGLEGFVEGAFQLIGAQANAGGITLVKDVEPTQVRMKAEALEQVIINLLMNAINASSKGSQVLVKASRKDGGIEFSVIDSGIGMDPEQVRKIFDPLYTAWPLKTGMGLGLSLAKEIVDSVGGRISVTSKLAEGSTFTVWIPEGKEG